MRRLTGKSCSITGASQGIGRVIVERLVTEGAEVVAADLRFSNNSPTEEWAAGGDLERARAEFIARQPVGRLGHVNEIAAALVMLASNEARFMTGSNVIMDGDMSL